MSTTTPKVVMFNMEIGDAPPEESADGAVDHNKLEEQVKELGQAIAGKYIIYLFLEKQINKTTKPIVP